MGTTEHSLHSACKLPTRMVEKPWGVSDLPAPFLSPPGKTIGEIWFEPPEALDQLLVKYIFTSEKLSVQVHPSDAQTMANGLGRQGKEECWLVISAEEGARLGIGFDQAISQDQMRAAALDGSIEDLLTWHDVRPGDFFYIPANTVHAIGAGVGVIEIQQNSDITYRLYDYGRPRELHLDEGMAVALGTPYPSGLKQHVPVEGEIMLVEGPLFRLIRYDGPLSAAAAGALAGEPFLIIPQSGEVLAGDARLAPGECALVEAIDALSIAAGQTGLIAQPLG